MIAIPLAFAFGQQLLGGLPIIEYLPWALLVPIAGSATSVIGAIIGGQPIQAYGAIVFTATVCVILPIVAFWRFERTEL